jgi:hypothetical protein
MTMRNSSKILRSGIIAANQAFQSLFDLDAKVAKATQPTRRSVFPAMAGYSLPRATIMVLMRFSLAR